MVHCLKMLISSPAYAYNFKALSVFIAKLLDFKVLKKIIPYAIFAHKRALPCVMKIILTQKLFGVGSSHFGFVHMDNWATH